MSHSNSQFELAVRIDVRPGVRPFYQSTAFREYAQGMHGPTITDLEQVSSYVHELRYNAQCTQQGVEDTTETTANVLLEIKRTQAVLVARTDHIEFGLARILKLLKTKL